VTSPEIRQRKVEDSPRWMFDGSAVNCWMTGGAGAGGGAVGAGGGGAGGGAGGAFFLQPAIESASERVNERKKIRFENMNIGS